MNSSIFDIGIRHNFILRVKIGYIKDNYIRNGEMKMSKILIAYFSASGVTEAVAKVIGEATNSDLFEIEPEQLYTNADLNWHDKNSRSSIEMKNPSVLPAVAKKVNNLEDYDTVFIGFPVWWYIAPTIINTFIEENDLTGKTVIPFATSGGSGIENCEDTLKKQYPELNWKKGKLFNRRVSIDMINDWLNQLS